MGDSFVATGLTIEDDLLSRAAKATKGYAYLVQLVGYSIWQRANLHRAKSAIVSERDVTEGIALAEARFHDVVHEPAISGLGLRWRAQTWCKSVLRSVAASPDVTPS